MTTTLFDTLKVGSLSVPSRIFMVRTVDFFDTVTFNLASTPSRDVTVFHTRSFADV
jgi:hypothetical protein